MRIIALNSEVCAIRMHEDILAGWLLLNFRQAIFSGGNWAVDYKNAK